MTKFKSAIRGDYHWLVAVCNGVWHWLHPMARLGDCHRPGQRLPEHRRTN